MHLPVNLRDCNSNELREIVTRSLYILHERGIITNQWPGVIYTNDLKHVTMSTRLYNILRGCLGMHSLSEIQEYYRSDFMNCRKAGKGTLTELEAIMKEHNLNWKK